MTEPASRSTLYRSAALVVAMQWSVRLIGLVSVLIIARLLSPEDFGLIGLATAALMLVELLGAVGLRQALLRVENPGREHFDTAWTLHVILFSAMGAISLAAAPLAASFYGQPALGTIIAVLSLRFFILGVANIGIVEFDRAYEFGRDLKMRIGSRLVAFVGTITAAVLLRNYWALVIGLLLQTGCFCIASYLAHPYRPRFSLKRRAELLGTSVWIFVHAVMQTIQMQIERLVLGRFSSPHTIGLFSVSKDLSEIFTQEIATGLNRVTFVTVARTGGSLSDSPLRVAQILGAYAMIAAPMGFGLVASAENAIVVLLGWNWVEAAPFLRIVAVYSALYTVYKVIASALQASGHAKRAAFMSGAGALCLVGVIGGTALVRPETMAVAAAALTANFLVLIMGIAVIARQSGQSGFALALHVFRPFAAAATMMVVVMTLAPQTGEPLIDLLGQMAMGAVSYPLLLLLLWAASGRPPGGEREAVAFVAELYSKLRRRSAVGEA
ncbi:MAG TPA: oligosaccharide flippase family protein [Allosphingosinicella sp.]|jgi:O-antigen/teichoic acid export membrane protein